MKISQILLSGAFVAAMTQFARAQEVTLTIEYFLGPKSVIQKDLLDPWTKKIEKTSNGRIKFEIFPSMSLGGRPDQLYRQVRDGVVDIVWTLPGYTPGVFPRLEVFELPGVHLGDAKATNLAIHDMLPDLKPDLKDVHPLLVHVYSGQGIATNKEIHTVNDMRGLKLRMPSRIQGWIIRSWNADPIGMPIPDLPQALSTNVVDGALTPLEPFDALRLHELVKYYVEGSDRSRFSNSPFLLLMNKDRYNGLPGDLKKLLDDNTGRDFYALAGDVWEKAEEKQRKLFIKSGGRVIGLTQEDKKAFDDASAGVVDRWIHEVKTKYGIDGAYLVGKAKTKIAK